MSRCARSVVVSLVLLLCAAWAGAQDPQPTGMIDPENPLLFTNDGVPDGEGDKPGVLQYLPPSTTGGIVLVDFGAEDCNDSPQHGAFAEANPTGGPVNTFFAAGSGVQVTTLDESDPAHPRPIGAQFGGVTLGGASQGTAEMLDSDGDHRYERMAVQGDKSGTPVAAELDLKYYDSDGDGLPEAVTLFDPAPADPEFNLGVLQFFGLFCDSGQYDEAWVPVGRDLDGDPAIIGDLDGNGIADPEFLWGPKLQRGRSVLAIPTLSEAGLAALAGFMLILALRTLRRRGAPAGA